MMDNVDIRQTVPDLKSFIDFRAECGWGEISEKVAEASLSSSVLLLTAWKSDKLVGFVRVVGDGALYFYVQDMIVIRELRGHGVGKALMKELMRQLSKIVPDGGAIGLMSALGKEPFYESFGFVRRPKGAFGAGMTYVPTNVSE